MTPTSQALNHRSQPAMGALGDVVWQGTCMGMAPRRNVAAMPASDPPHVPTAPVVDLGHGVHAIDTLMGGYDGIAASYAILSDRPALVETGTALSAPTVVAALAALGIHAADLATVVVTHIHLDHAGGVGDIARAFPNAQIVVHERGARHLAEPARLMASARRVFGADMDRLFGDLLPVPHERIVTLGAEGSIDLGAGRSLQAFHAPGHASHHVGLLDTVSGDLFTGDAAGVYVPETADVRPATPPPDFDLDLTITSIERMRAAQPHRLLFSHFGPVTDVNGTLDRSVEELRIWVDLVRRSRDAGHDTEHAIAMVRQRSLERSPESFHDAELSEKFEALSSIRANVEGIQHWLLSQESESDSGQS
jgi:glyoxylase-like metal-dependent hydrolase (beta-lactamase superfamily II)